MSTAAQIAAQRVRVVAAISRVAGIEAGALREVLDQIDGAVSDEVLLDKGYHKISKSVGFADLAVAATTLVVPFDDEIPAGAIVVAASIDLPTDFAGGAISAATVDVGDADADRFINLTNIFTGAGPLTDSQADPGVGLDRSLAGDAIIPAAVTPDLLFTSTTADLDALTAGAMTANIYYTLPASA
ncbi:hypothetical protein LCGC14_1887410 [marine sediment metagenome]|uniref:Uncharacterized protein n=1 Tax=marine sediment metagenome TaxID=412755 RepID=A0A0F9GNR1_9ZZZZ